MKYCDFSEAKVGDKVWSIRHGWAEIIDICNSKDYPILVITEEKEKVSFTTTGKFNKNDMYPILFWNEFKIPNEAFEKPKPKILEVDTLVWVWNEYESEKLLRFFSHFDECGNIYTFNNGRDSSRGLHNMIKWDNWELYGQE